MQTHGKLTKVPSSFGQITQMQKFQEMRAMYFEMISMNFFKPGPSAFSSGNGLESIVIYLSHKLPAFVSI